MAVFEPHPTAAYRNIDGHIFVITPDSRQHELHGAVELFLWQLCEEKPQSKNELITAVLDRFDVDESVASNDIEHFLSELTEAGVFKSID